MNGFIICFTYSEQEILREEIASLNAVKSRMNLHIHELEEALKKTKEELEKKAATKSDDEEDVPLAQRKRFTRVEMARVLMERNQYKERYMELQDAVRWTEMLRAAKQDPSLEKRNNKGIFNLLVQKTHCIISGSLKYNKLYVSVSATSSVKGRHLQDQGQPTDWSPQVE